MLEFVYTILFINALVTISSVLFKDMLEFWRSAEGSLQVCSSAHLPAAAERVPDRCSPPSCTGRNQAGSSLEPSHVEGRHSDHTLYLEALHIPGRLFLTLRVAPHVSYLITTGQEKCILSLKMAPSGIKRVPQWGQVNEAE